MKPISSSPSLVTWGLSSSNQQVWRKTCRRTAPKTIGLQNSNRIQRRFRSHIAKEGDQARPLEGFYAELLSHPLSKLQAASRTRPVPPPSDSSPRTEKEETLEEPRIVFGSRLAGPGERRAQIDAASKVIAGVLVPPKPTEPDNCCMSGCVNCVWDLYRDEMEEWAAKAAEARAALQAQRQAGKGTGMMAARPGTPSHVATSMDDDGGGSETNWVLEASPEHLFDDIPVGIREFMKTEKKLKLKHRAEQAVN
ncbi:uncharacterized protein EI97DRAFT_427549 [Westerdykella ornata]|uniref:Oxidoreductase-like domain-containing protein n=1 Tax=Westerdykella ornata TaxID=318751 RepID=A0A6A6J5E2_WESOR|nr:uncharacterized protein EI97DRAFT_427549 [Westerdykella ornata]KAF2271810.1 hypothetical protein EI97DRAFT_427549 [Westerdykella ornata]